MSRNNHLEDNFFKTFRPVFIAQLIAGNARTNVVNTSVLPRFWYQKVYSCISVVICCVSVMYLTKNSAFYEIDDDWSIQTILSYSAVCTTLFINGFTVFINNFFNVSANCDLITKMKQIDQDLKITNEYHYKDLYRLIWFLVAFAILFHGFGNVVLVVQNLGFREIYVTVPAVITLTAQDLELVLYLAIIMFLILRVRYINTMLDKSIAGNWESLEHFTSSQFLRNLFYAYQKIVIAYNLTEITFNHFLFLLVLHMFSNEMVALERCIVQGKLMKWSTIYQTLMVVCKVYNRILVVGLFVRYLQAQIKITNICCIRVITHTKSMETRRQAKNIRRLISLVRPMTIFRMFNISTLPLQLAAVTATYSVVLLQFAFQNHESVINNATVTSS